MTDDISTVPYRKKLKIESVCELNQKRDHFRTKAILYYRVDSPENDFTMDIIQGQKNFLLSYAQAHNMDVEQIYMNIGCSSTTLERAGLQAATRAIQNGSADVILVANRSRLFRGLFPPELRKLPVISVMEREAVFNSVNFL